MKTCRQDDAATMRDFENLFESCKSINHNKGIHQVSSIIYNHGGIHYKNKSYKSAIKFFTYSINILPDIDSSLIKRFENTSACYHLLEEYKEAISWYIKTLSLLKPDFKCIDNVNIQVTRIIEKIIKCEIELGVYIPLITQTGLENISEIELIVLQYLNCNIEYQLKIVDLLILENGNDVLKMSKFLLEKAKILYSTGNNLVIDTCMKSVLVLKEAGLNDELRNENLAISYVYLGVFSRDSSNTSRALNIWKNALDKVPLFTLESSIFISNLEKSKITKLEYKIKDLEKTLFHIRILYLIIELLCEYFSLVCNHLDLITASRIQLQVLLILRKAETTDSCINS